MVKNEFLMVSLILAFAVGEISCNGNDEIENNPILVRFTTSIEQAILNDAAPKAAGTAWGEGDVIGIFMSDDTGVTGNNKRYRISIPQDGIFEAATENEALYYPEDGSSVSFIAYYPYESSATPATPLQVAVETTQTADNQPEFDLLYSDNATGYNKKSTSAATLNFVHKLAKMVINCKLADNVGESAQGMTVKIKNMSTRNTLDLLTGKLNTATDAADIIPRTMIDGQAYEAIIMPESYTDGTVTVDFTLATGETFTWNVGDESFESGNEYIYTVTLTRTGVEVTGTITPWTKNDRGTVVAE